MVSLATVALSESPQMSTALALNLTPVASALYQGVGLPGTGQGSPGLPQQVSPGPQSCVQYSGH